jgi:hypothetical protein
MYMRQDLCIKKHIRIVDFHAAERLRAIRNVFRERGTFLPLTLGTKHQTARTVNQEKKKPVNQEKKNPVTSNRRK